MSVTGSPRYIAARLLIHCRTIAQWTATNPVPKRGEFVGESGTVMKVKIGDGTTPYITLPYVFSGGSGGSGDLQAVTDVGNITTNGIVSGSGTGPFDTFGLLDNQNIGLWRAGTALIQLFRETVGPNSRGLLTFVDETTGNYNSIALTPTMTGGWEVLLPDEGSGSDLDRTIVLHTTKDPVVVTDGFGNQAEHSNIRFLVNKITGLVTQQSGSFGDLFRLFYDDGVLTTWQANIKLGTPAPGTATVDNLLIDNYGGTTQHFAMKSDIPGSHPVGTPAFTSYGPAAGTAPGVSSIFGDDRTGQVVFTTGSSTPNTAGAIVFTMTFNTPWTSAVLYWSVYVQGATNPLAINNLVCYTGAAATATLQLASAGIALAASTSYIIVYQVVPPL